MWNGRNYESLKSIKSKIRIEKIDLYQKANMKIEKIATSPKLQIFFAKCWISKLEKFEKFANFPIPNSITKIVNLKKL